MIGDPGDATWLTRPRLLEAMERRGFIDVARVCSVHERQRQVGPLSTLLEDLSDTHIGGDSASLTLSFAQNYPKDDVGTELKRITAAFEDLHCADIL